MQRPRSADFRSDINGLRAVSVILVVLFHFELPGFSGGFIGVDVFFVISGYLMTKIIASGLARGDFSYVRFVAARASRIVPALYVLLAMLMVVGLVLLAPLDLYRLGEQAATAALFFSNVHFHDAQAYFIGGLDDRWLLHTWSLSVEWQFYLIYPLLLSGAALLLAKTSSSARFGMQHTRMLRWLVALLLVVSFLHCVRTTAVSPKSAFFLLLPRAWEMLAGGLVFLSERRDGAAMSARLRALLGHLGLAIIVASTAVIGWLGLEADWPGAYALMPVSGACLTLWACDRSNRVLNVSLMQRAGDASYSIYLYHWPIVVAINVTSFVHMHMTSARLLGIVLSFGLGWLSYRWIESHKLLGTLRPWPALGTATAAAATLALAGIAIVGSDGVAARTGDDRERHVKLIAADTSGDRLAACRNEFKPEHEWKLCVLNPREPGRRTLVLGDSHAGHLYPWFVRHAQTRTEFFIQNGCTLSPGFEKTEPGYRCARYSELGYRLAASGRYDTVILSSKWRGSSSSTNGFCSYDAAGNCVPAERLTADRSPVRALNDSIERLLARDVEVIVVDDSPAAGFNVPRRASRELFWSGEAAPPIDFDKHLQANREFDSLFANLRRHPKFHLVSFRDELCARNTCAITDPATLTPVYRDRDHFNPAWLVAHGRELRPFVVGPAIDVPTAMLSRSAAKPAPQALTSLALKHNWPAAPTH